MDVLTVNSVATMMDKIQARFSKERTQIKKRSALQKNGNEYLKTKTEC